MNCSQSQKNDVLSPLHLKILFYVLTDNLGFAVRSLAELVDDLMRVLLPKILKEDRDTKTKRALQIALAVGSAYEEFCGVVVVTDVRPI